MENGDRDFAKAIRGIIATYGKTTLNDIRRVNALLMDLAPGQARKRKLIVTALEEGIGTDLIRGVAQKETERILCFNRCVKHLMAEAWVTEEAARFAVYTIAEAVEFEVSVPPAIRAEEAGAVEKEWGKENRPGSVDISKALCGYSVIGYKAFAANVDLTEVHIPPGVKKIKPKAFIDCVNLRRIALPASIEEVGSDVFAGCDALEIVDIEKNSNYGIVAGLVIDKKRKAVIRATGKIDPVCVIPGEIEAIRPRAFERSKVQEITIPRSLGAFDAEAVRLCSQLRQFNIERNHIIFSTIEGVLHSKDRCTLIRFPTGYEGACYVVDEKVSRIGRGAFSAAVNLETVTFSNSLKTIGPKAFEYCPRLSSLMIPNSVEIIGERAFQYCEKLAGVMLPRSIQEIGDFAFCGCRSIQTVNIPKTVKRIGHSAFKGCSRLEKIIIQDEVAFIGDSAFSGCAKTLEVVIKDNSYVKQYCSAHKIAWSEL